MKELYEKFLNKKIEIGSQHFYDSTKLFFQHGIVTAVTDYALEIETEKGLVIINYDRIKVLREMR